MSTIRGLPQATRVQLEQQRNHDIVEVSSAAEQCNFALGEIPLDGRTRCYICDASLIPHIDVFREKLMNQYGDVSSEYSRSPWVLPAAPHDHCYPECDHIIACNAINENINPWLLNIMVYSLIMKIMKFQQGFIPIPDNAEFTSDYITNHLDTPLDGQPGEEDRKLMWFINVISRINYAWTHRGCNGPKSHFDFVCHDYLPLPNGVYRKILHPKNYHDIRDILYNKIYNANSGNFVNGILEHFLNIQQKKNPSSTQIINILPRIANGPFRLNESQHKLADVTNRGTESVLNRVELLCKCYNNTTELDHIENYVIPSDNGTLGHILVRLNDRRRRRGGVGELLQTTNNSPTPKTSKKEVDIVKKIIKKTILDTSKKTQRESLKSISKLRESNTNKKTSDVDLLIFMENIKHKKQSVDTLKFLTNYLKTSKYQENSNIQNLINVFERSLPESESIYDKELLEHINKLKNTNAFKILLLLLTYDYSKIEKLKINSYNYYLKNIYKSSNAKEEYIKFITFNTKLSDKKLYAVAEEIFKETTEEHIAYQLYIINFFKSVLLEVYKENNINFNNIDIDIDNDIYAIAKTYYNLSISFGLLYKNNKEKSKKLRKTI
jgi:hypothetical protein